MVLLISVDELLSLSERIDTKSIGQCTLHTSIETQRIYLKLILAEVLPQEGSTLNILLPEQLA